MIDWRGVRALQAVAEHGTVTAAAAALNFTPSAVSQQIGQLATELGTELLQRHGRRVRLTPAARTLLEKSQEIATLWEQTRAELSDSTGEAYGQLRFCGVSSAVVACIAPAASRLRETHPRIETLIREEETTDCYRLLAD